MMCFVYCVQVITCITSNCGFDHMNKEFGYSYWKKQKTNLYAKSNHKLTHVICLVKQNQSFSQTEDVLCKTGSKWTCSNVPDAHFNAHASHNMNLRKQMAFRPFLQNVSQIHWQKKRKRNKVGACVQVILKEKTRISLSVSCYTWLFSVFFLKNLHTHGYLEGKTVKSY